jgi:tRNA(Ile)-lysidine synthase
VLSVARGGNLQARARQARYEALAAAAARAKARAIATAHHADDRAETFLLRLLRGAGPAGLAVLPPRAPLPIAPAPGSRGPRGDRELLRPLLRARRADIRAHVERHAIPFADDPSNDDPRFARTRVRRELLPLLAELSPGIVSHLEALADQLHASADGAGPELPRATQRALKELLRSPQARGGPGGAPSRPGGPDKARVWLPGGLVVTRESAEKTGPNEASPHAARETRRAPRERRAARPSAPRTRAKTT